MIRVMPVAPPDHRPHIVQIVRLDFDLFETTHIVGADHIHTLGVDGDGTIQRIASRLGSLPSLSRTNPYLVTFSDGIICRSNTVALESALRVLGQEWPNPEPQP